MCVADKTEIAHEVLSYLSEHRDAQDTLTGIVEWWLLEHRIRQQHKAVEEALADLVSKKLILARKSPDQQICYRVNRNSSKRISALLGREAESKKRKD